MTVAKARNIAPPRRPEQAPRAPDLPRPGRVRTTSGAATDAPIVVDDLPDAIPVTAAELEVIETYLGPLIDRLLAGAASRAVGTSSSTVNQEMPGRVSRPRP